MSGASPRTAVFAYGSLVDRASAERTLGRDLGPPLATRLEGWCRRFSLCRDNLRSEKMFAAADGAVPSFVLGLNVERSDDPALAPDGVLLEVGDAELDRLDLREMRYDRRDVTDAVPAAAAAGFERVVTYVAKPGHFAPIPPSGAVIIAAYARTVEAAFDALSPAHGARYRETMLPYPAKLIEGVLVQDSIPEGNPRDW